MYKILILVSLFVFNSCASTANQDSMQSDTQTATDEELEDIKIESQLTPVDIWERIRQNLTITIPADQIAATSLYRERLYSNQTSVNRISKSGQRYLYHTLSKAQELSLIHI